MVVSLEFFKDCMHHIEAHIAKDEILTELFISEDSVAWVNSAPELMNDLITLLTNSFGEGKEEIEWWLWERDENNDSYEFELNGEWCRVHIKTLDDLYYSLTEQYDKIEDVEYDIDPNAVGNIRREEDITAHDLFMNTMFGYTESDN